MTYTTRADLMAHPAFAHMNTDSDGNPCVWANHYRCDHMGDTDDEPESWQDFWSCQCDDDCPICGRDCEPEESVWIGPEAPDLVALWESLPEAEGQGWGASVMQGRRW